MKLSMISGIPRRKVNILWAIKHPLQLGCLLYIVFQLIDETQCSSKPDKNSIPATIKSIKLHPSEGTGRKSGIYRLASSDWFSHSQNRNQTDSAESLLGSINSKVDKINENLERFIRVLKPDNRSECNSSQILDKSSQIKFSLNNVSIANSENNSDTAEATSEETEIKLGSEDESAELPGNLHTNEDQSRGTTNETEKIPEEITRNLRESKEHPSEQIETDQSNSSNGTLTSTIQSNNVSPDLNDIETSQDDNYDNSTPPRNDDSNKLFPTIPTEMAEDITINEHTQQSTEFSNLLAVNLQSANLTTQQKPLESYRMSETSSSTPRQSESSSMQQSTDFSGLLATNSQPSKSITQQKPLESDSTSEASSSTPIYQLKLNSTLHSTDFSGLLTANSQPGKSITQQKPLESDSTSEASSSTPIYQSKLNSTLHSTDFSGLLAVNSQPGNLSTQQRPSESYSTSEASSSTPRYQSESSLTQQSTDFSNLLAVNSQPGNLTTQQKPLESYRVNEASSSTPRQSESSSTFISEEILKAIPKSASFAMNTNTSSSQVKSLDPGYSLKRIVLQGVDRIRSTLDEHKLKSPQNDADVYLFYYIPGAMNLHQSGDYVYSPNEHKQYEGGYLKHRYTAGRSSQDYSAHSLQDHKLMHSYAKSKQRTESASISTRQTNQTSNALSANITAADQKPKNEQSTVYYFVAPYFHSNHTFGNFRFSNPESPLVQQTNETVTENTQDHNVGKGKRFKRDTTRSPNFSDSANEEDCSGDVKWCADGVQCIKQKQWCNQIVDCLDKSDELNCTCKERMDEKRICDHYIDCPDGEDEKGCFGCPEDAFSCDHEMPPGYKARCIPMSQRCDRQYDCNDGSDELDCELLSDSVDIHETFHTSYTSGYLHRNYMGKWYPACIEIHSEHVWGAQACRAELGFNVKHIEAELLLFHGNYAGKFITHDAMGDIGFVDICKYPGYAVHVKCPSVPCGKRIAARNYLGINHHRSKRMAPKDSKHELVYTALELFFGKRERLDPKVVRGTDSNPGDWPWLVALYRDGELNCGGAIIDETWILTAGHCVYKYSSHFYEVYAGRLRRLSFSPNEQLRIVTHVIIHPEYSHTDLKNDLALLKLNEPLKFNRWVRPVCLPVDRPPWGPIAGTVCNAAGWGSIWEKGPHPDNLMEVKLPIRSRCKDKVDRDGEEICAGYEQGGFDTCQGDSGGPLLCNLPRVHEQWYVAGVVSHGEGCARAHEPGAYTRVALFIPWIITHTDNKFLTLASESYPKCPHMKCLYEGRCVGRKQICDGVVDCLFAEDEYEINCGYSEYDHRRLTEYRKSSESADEIKNRSHLTAANATKSNSPVEVSSEQSGDVHHFQSMSQVKESLFSVLDASSTSESHLNDEPVIEKRETSSYFTCQNLPQNIRLEFHCDTEVDCEDGTDEINCSCADYLKVTNESLICDGIIHCHDLSDEKYCQDYNCTSDEFFCYKSRSCIRKELVCDGKKHCLHGEDEYRCYWPLSVATTTLIQNQFDMFGAPLFSDKGVLAYNDRSVWKWLCFPVEENEVEVPKTIMKLAKRLGFKNYKTYSHLMVFDDEVLNKRQQNYCPGLMVDFAVAHVEDESLIPWRVSIFVNGISTCLGVLIQEEWVLTDQSCCLKLNTSTDYIVAVFGSDEKLSKKIRSYEEQIVLVDKIRCDKQANTALLHLHEKTRTTEKTKSLGVISTLEKLEPKQNFLLILEDARSAIFELKVKSNCPPASLCYKMKYDTNFCSNSSLKFASVIGLSRKKEWIFSGIVDESLTCLTNETVVTINLPQSVSSQENIFVNITEFYYRGHRVYRCSLGNQISWENVCDGKRDCRENEDEIDLACQEKKFLIERKFIKPSCRVDEFECKNGRCVSKSGICDSKDDCGDNTDEPDACSNFSCAAYLNLTNPRKLCDSLRDCEDKSDENIENCPSLCDSPSSFRCNKSNSCIPLDFVCDGERDCEFGEDEEKCISYKIAGSNGTEGEIWMQYRGQWKQQCFTPSEMVAFDVQNLCQQFGYSQATNNRTIPATSYIYIHSMPVRLNNFVEVNLERNSEKRINSTEYCEYLYISCR